LSSNAAPVFRLFLFGLGVCGGSLATHPLAAQDDAGVTPSEIAEAEPATAEPDADAEEDDDNERVIVNLAITSPRRDPSQAQVQECEDRVEAGQISGEIVVCRQLGEDPDNYYSSSREEAQRRYAEETAFANSPGTPDVAGGGIFRGPATVSGQCFLPPCPDEPALLIDVEALPKAPAGSDADRIARGLPPLNQEEPTPEEIRKRREALGLPAPQISSEESEAPVEQP